MPALRIFLNRCVHGRLTISRLSTSVRRQDYLFESSVDVSRHSKETTENPWGKASVIATEKMSHSLQVPSPSTHGMSSRGKNAELSPVRGTEEAHASEDDEADEDDVDMAFDDWSLPPLPERSFSGTASSPDIPGGTRSDIADRINTHSDVAPWPTSTSPNLDHGWWAWHGHSLKTIAEEDVASVKSQKA